MSFRVLVVCTGNICRSPMAEQLLRAGLDERFEVQSAGTLDLGGSPMEPHAVSVLAELGLDGSAHTSQQLTPELVQQADLVLTATRAHRAAVVELDPTAIGRTFTVRELDRLLDGAPDGDPVTAAAGRRGTSRPAKPADDDLADPYRQSEKEFRDCLLLLEQALARPIERLSASPGR